MHNYYKNKDNSVYHLLNGYDHETEPPLFQKKNPERLDGLTLVICCKCRKQVLMCYYCTSRLVLATDKWLPGMTLGPEEVDECCCQFIQNADKCDKPFLFYLK